MAYSDVAMIEQYHFIEYYLIAYRMEGDCIAKVCDLSIEWERSMLEEYERHPSREQVV